MCRQLYQSVWLEMKGGEHESGFEMSRFYRVVTSQSIHSQQPDRDQITIYMPPTKPQLKKCRYINSRSRRERIGWVRKDVGYLKGQQTCCWKKGRDET